jgi:uncharacterized protein (UPF0333 family)
MFKKKKGQGALEYLLLIGGAVLIAVIVIALLVGMGGQSRDTAQDQANRVQQATDVPQPAQIVSVRAPYDECGDGNISVSWRPLGEGGSNEMVVLDSSNTELQIDDAGTRKVLDPNDLTFNVRVDLTSAHECGDSYYVKIITEKNNQEVTSSAYQFSWID